MKLPKKLIKKPTSKKIRKSNSTFGILINKIKFKDIIKIRKKRRKIINPITTAILFSLENVYFQYKSLSDILTHSFK